MWENTIKILTSFGNEVVNAYKQGLIAADAYTQLSHKLYDSVVLNVPKADGSHFEVSINLIEYWKYVEWGRSAGKMPPIDSIVEWTKVKPISIEASTSNSFAAVVPDTSGKQLNEDSARRRLAYLIARKIGQVGIKPRPILKTSVEDTFNEFKYQITAAVKTDMNTQLIKITNQLFGGSTIEL